MSRTVCVASGGWCVLVLLGAVGRAQGPAAPVATPATLVAVIDIARVFESYPAFKASMDAIQQQAKSVDLDLETKRKSLSQRNQQLTELNADSSDYRQLEADLARQVADLQVQARQVKKDLLLQQARQYYTSYNEILAAVDRVARRHGIALVLRFDTHAMNPDEPQSVMQGINQEVVLQRNLDITSMVIEELQTALAQSSSSRAPRR